MSHRYPRSSDEPGSTSCCSAWSRSLPHRLPGPADREGRPARRGLRAGRPRRALTDLAVYPPEIQLTTARDRQSIVVQATFADGITRDVTKEATLTLADPELVRRDGAILYPAADGATTLDRRATSGRTVTVPVKVAQATAQPPLSFRLDVMPVFMRAGCNTGSCHGAARGKDGFRISLFGFDPEGDHFRLTREMVGRRVNLAVPSDSTLLEKAIGAVQHTGGKRFESTSELYQTLHGWIEAGAPNDDVAKLPTVVGVDLYPKQAVLDGKGATQQLTVRARYSDGTDRDVTSLAVFLTNNDVSAPVTPDGLVTAGERGEAFVMARFETHTVGSQFIVLPKGLKFTYPRASPRATTSTSWSPPSSRSCGSRPRACATTRPSSAASSIDIVGLPPTVEEYNRFMASTDPEQAGEVDRRAARAQGVLRDLGVEVGRAAPDPHRPDQERQPEGDVPLLQLAGRQALEEHADGRDGPGAARRQRRHVQERRDQLLPDHQRDPAADRERRAGLHGHPGPVRPVPQPPVRPLDPERLLQLRGVLRPDRPQAGRGLSRDDRLQLRRRRGDPPRRRPRHAAQVPRRRGPRRRRQGPPRRAGQVAGLAAEPLVRHLVRQPRLGPLHGRRGSSSRSTTSASATRPRTPSCSRPWASTSPTRSTTSRRWSATSATRGPTSARPSATRATRATSGTSPMPWSAGSRPRACSTRSAP